MRWPDYEYETIRVHVVDESAFSNVSVLDRRISIRDDGFKLQIEQAQVSVESIE